MRFNKQELFAVGSQTSPNFDREGVLILKERQEGFFRRSEGCTVRWFRLRGNLLFYLKGPEPWYEPMGVIVLGQHQIKVQNIDENGHWPFHIAWENGVCYRMATFQESERILWLKAIEMAPYDKIHANIVELKEKLNKIRTVVDIATYRLKEGIVVDTHEVPLCELALSCDNLVCDTHGRAPSPVVVVYVHYPKGQCVLYDTTEVLESCSNPSFSKSVVFRASDGLTGDATVRLAVLDVRERVSETAVPLGYTAVKLATIQEAQRLRVALQTKDNKTVGFVTINGWSLEPSSIGASPSHNEPNTIDIPQKVHCHRRSQSLPLRLGLKLKFPSCSKLIKQNFTNGHQVTYRFHSGLGGDITVHESISEPKICFQMPIQLLDIFISREKELLEGLLSIGEVTGQWRSRQAELLKTHLALLKHYCHSRQAMKNAHGYFKPSSRKEEANLQFAPVNLHLQRMWVHNDTLNKSGFHDIVTAGAFAAHAHKTARGGGLIRLVQQAKDINSSRAEISSMTSKLSAEYDNILTVKSQLNELATALEKVLMRLQAAQYNEALSCLQGIKNKIKNILALWDPLLVEDSLSYIGWPKNNLNNENHTQPCLYKPSHCWARAIFSLYEKDKVIVYHAAQVRVGRLHTSLRTTCSKMRLPEEFRTLGTFNSDYDFDASSSSSSKETSPTENPTFSSSVPDIKHKLTDNELHFHNEYFEERDERSERIRNHSFRSVRSPAKTNFSGAQSLSLESRRHRSLRYNFKSSASLEQVSYKNLVDSVTKNDLKRAESIRDSLPIASVHVDETTRNNNLTILRSVGTGVEDALAAVSSAVDNIVQKGEYSEDEFTAAQELSERLKADADVVTRWLRLSHAARRLRWESPAWAWEHVSLQTRRDICFAQALATVTAGLVCWLCSTPCDVIVKLLTIGLGPLCGFEGLLSLHGAEKAMWGDMVIAVEDLHTVLFNLSKIGHSNTATPQVTGTRNALTVQLPVSDSLYARFSSKQHLSFTITAVFFNVGVNEKATLAEALGESTPQQQSNSDNLDRLNKYYHKYTKAFPADPMEPARASSRTKPLAEVMENLNTAVHKKVPKNTEVLHLAASATRLMNGIRFTSCKSAKDRTGMAVTLEQCSILSSEYHLAQHEQKKALNILRSEGCRRQNTQKNIGIKKYAFTKKQVMALPEEYRPPPGTYGTSQT